MSFHVTDQDVVKDASYALLENAGIDATTTFSTSMFTTDQFINALNDRQRRFLRETGCVLKRVTLGATPQTSRYPLPDDWIATTRLAWMPEEGSAYPLPRSDAYELDQALTTWGYDSGDPLVFQEETLPTLTTEIIPAPSNTGQLGLLYVALSEALDNSGIVLTVPDELAWAVKWGAIGDLLKQDGEGSDPKRAAYCEMRYQQGVEMCRLLLGGPRS